MLAECPICMNEMSVVGVHGCDHKFCLKCIKTWVVQHVALCPLCIQPIYGVFDLHRPLNGCFLTPHHGRFGLTIREFRTRMIIGSIVEGTVAGRMMNDEWKVGDVININGITEFEKGARCMREALKKKRMIFISRGREPATPGVAATGWRCLSSCPAAWRGAPILSYVEDVENETIAPRQGT